MKRLDGLDLLITDWMLGFSILLLIAIRFAPSLVGQQVTARAMEVPAVFKLRQGAGPFISDVDLKEPISFAAKLRIANDPLSQYLKEHLSSETKRQLEQYDGTSALPEGLLINLTGDLNKLIAGLSLYDEQRFAQVTLTDGTRALIGQRLQGEELAQLNRLLLEEAYSKELAKSQEEFMAAADNSGVQFTEVCPLDNTALKNHRCGKCGNQYPIQLVRTLPQKILYILLILFVVKYIHERSVMRFRLYEDDREDGTQDQFREQLQNLHRRSNHAYLNFLVFLFRLLFLSTFYLFLINLYIKSNGQFQDFKDAIYYAVVLACGYFVPDICLFVATMGQGYQTIKAWLSPSKILIFLVVVIVLFFIFFFVGHKYNWDTFGGYLIFLIALLVLPGWALIMVLRKFDQCSIEITALKWLLLDVFNVIALIAFGIAATIQNIDVTWIACAVLIVNLLDWLFNAWFYYGTSKFTIHGKQI